MEGNSRINVTDNPNSRKWAISAGWSRTKKYFALKMASKSTKKCAFFNKKCARLNGKLLKTREFLLVLIPFFEFDILAELIVKLGVLPPRHSLNYAWDR